MLVLFSLILLVIGAALIGGIYAIFTPFIDQLGSIQHYNMAYYGAVSSLERAHLVLRGHQPGFEGEGGWMPLPITGSPASDYFGSNDRNYWGLMAVSNNGQKWTIKSMVDGDTIPFSGQGNIDPDMAFDLTDPNFSAYTDSFGFNKLEFGSPIQIALYQDTTPNTASDEYYQAAVPGRITDIVASGLKVHMRVPPKIYKGFGGGGLELALSSHDEDGDKIPNDTVAIRSLFGVDDAGEEFSIIPSIDVDYNPGSEIVNPGDSSIREETINSYDENEVTANIDFFGGQNPVSTNDPTGGLYLIPTDANGLSTGNNLADLLNGTIDTDRMHMKLSLANILRYNNENIYPYLEVKIDAGTPIPDLFYHITAESKIGKYNVKLRTDRPIFETSEAGDYVILF